mgnify:CR=1 FL=1
MEKDYQTLLDRQDPLGSDPFADFFKEIKRQNQQRPTPAQGPQTKFIH